MRARRAAGEYPPGFERDLDVLFDRFAPPEVSNDFDAALERSEDLVIIEPVIPVASRNPVLGIVKRIVAEADRLVPRRGWRSRSPRWQPRSTTHCGCSASGWSSSSSVTGDSRAARADRRACSRRARRRAVGQQRYSTPCAGATGRIAVVECGDGRPARGPRRGRARRVRRRAPRRRAPISLAARGLEIRHRRRRRRTSQSVGDGRARRARAARHRRARHGRRAACSCVEAAAASCSCPVAALVVCSLTPRGVGRRRRPPSRPTSSPATRCTPTRWAAPARRARFTDVRVQPAGTDAYISARPRARRRMTAIHQFVPTLAPRDAVGSHYLASRRRCATPAIAPRSTRTRPSTNTSSSRDRSRPSTVPVAARPRGCSTTRRSAHRLPSSSTLATSP